MIKRSAALLGASVLVVLAACGGDDGNNNNQDTCGDGHVTGAEQCDDGNTVSGDGCSATCRTESSGGVCGDNFVDLTTEECDDGNTVSGDGCSATCQTERPDTCGDGTVDTGEGCDDHNTMNGDGCSSTCTVEQGYTCTGSPSVCTMTTQTADGTCAAPFEVSFTPGTGTDLVGMGSGNTTTGMDNIPEADCGILVSGGANDHIWTFTITDVRDVVVTLDADTAFDGGIRLMSGCDAAMVIDDTQALGGCSDLWYSEHIEQLTWASLPAGTYYLAIDGYDDFEVGAYSFHVRASVPSCGNGLIGSGEECDDGNTTNGDRCSSTCVLESSVTEVEPNDTTPQVLPSGSQVIRGEYSETDADLYTFTLDAPSTVEIEVYSTVDASWSYDGVGTNPAFDCGIFDDSQLLLFDASGDPTDDFTAIYYDYDDGALFCPYLGAHDADGDTTELVDLPAGTYTLKLSGDLYPPATPSRYLIDLKITSNLPSTAVPPMPGDIVLNEFMAADNMSDTNCDGATTSTNDEFVELVNVSAKTLDLTGVTLWDATNLQFTFAAQAHGSLTLAPGKAVVVWAGGAPSCPGVTNFFVGTNSTLSLNDGGDTIQLKSADTTPVTLLSYTYPAATPNVSFNLSPDVTGTAYALHDAVTGAVGAFSPGLRADGTAF